MFLLSRLDVDSDPWVASLYMLVVGIGLGLVMQVLVLIVQNDARPQDIGVVTSTATFFRSVGGSFGVALFGAIFASRLANELTRLPADVIARLGDVGAIDPARARQLPPEVRADFLQIFANALHGVFLCGHGDRDRPGRPLLVPQGGAAPDDARRAAAPPDRGIGVRGARSSLRSRRRGVALTASANASHARIGRVRHRLRRRRRARARAGRGAGRSRPRCRPSCLRGDVVVEEALRHVEDPLARAAPIVSKASSKPASAGL